MEATVKYTNESLKESINSGFASVMEKLPETLETMLMERFNVEGVQQVTRGDIQAMLAGSHATLLKEIQALRTGGLSDGSYAVDTSASRSQGGSSELFNWNGGFHMVPEDFSFPT